MQLVEQVAAIDPQRDPAVLAVETLSEPETIKLFADGYILYIRRLSLNDSDGIIDSLVDWWRDKSLNRRVALGHLMLRALDHSQSAFAQWHNVLEQHAMWPPPPEKE